MGGGLKRRSYSSSRRCFDIFTVMLLLLLPTCSGQHNGTSSVSSTRNMGLTVADRNLPVGFCITLLRSLAIASKQQSYRNKGSIGKHVLKARPPVETFIKIPTQSARRPMTLVKERRTFFWSLLVPLAAGRKPFPCTGMGLLRPCMLTYRLPPAPLINLPLFTSQVLAEIKAAPRPHTLEFMRYDMRFDRISLKWETLEDIRRQGKYVRDAREEVRGRCYFCCC